jgi:hypothetical protein
VNLGFCRTKIRVSPSIVGEENGSEPSTFAMFLRYIFFSSTSGFLIGRHKRWRSNLQGLVVLGSDLLKPFETVTRESLLSTWNRSCTRSAVCVGDNEIRKIIFSWFVHPPKFPSTFSSLKCQQCAPNLRDDPGLVAIYPNP